MQARILEDCVFVSDEKSQRLYLQLTKEMAILNKYALPEGLRAVDVINQGQVFVC